MSTSENIRFDQKKDTLQTSKYVQKCPVCYKNVATIHLIMCQHKTCRLCAYSSRTCLLCSQPIEARISDSLSSVVPII